MQRKDASCADIINSKEKVIPSHNVNSPSWFPVNKRLPPGVHDNDMTGLEFFARVTCANCVQYTLAGLLYPMQSDIGKDMYRI